MNTKELWNFTARQNGNADVQMYGSINQWGQVNAKWFAEKIRELERNFESVTLRIYSPGGSIFEGVAMHHTLQQTGLTVTVIIEGLAASMMSAVIMGADQRKIAPFGRMMLHQGRGAVRGSGNELIRQGRLLNALNEDLAEMYASVTGKNADWILANWLKEGVDTWFTAKQSLTAKLVDSIITTTKTLPTPKKAAQVTQWEDLAACYDPAFLPKTKKVAHSTTDATTVAALIAIGKERGIITAQSQQEWSRLATRDFTVATELLASLPVVPKSNAALISAAFHK